MHPLRALSSLLTLLLSAYFALWACAPASSLRPPTLDMAAPNETGFAVAGSVFPSHTTWTEAEIQWIYNVPVSRGFSRPDPGMDIQVWQERRMGRRLSAGGVLSVGTTTPVAAGFFGRWWAVEGERIRLGVDFEAGYFYAAGGLSFAWRIAPGWWTYATPSIGLRNNGVLRLPVGFEIPLGKGFELIVEGTVKYANDGVTTSAPDDVGYTAAVGLNRRY